MSKNQIDPEAVKARLFQSAAGMGTAKKAEAEAEKAALQKAQERLTIARDGVTEESRRAAGFATPMFTGLAELGALWGSSFNDPDSPLAAESAKGMAESFMVSFTGATDATKKGGTMAGYADNIRMGKLAVRTLQSIQNRLEFWQAKADGAKDDNTEEGKAIRETAARFTVIPGPSLDKDGKWPTRADKSDESARVPYPPKHNGRAACVVNGISLPHRGATDRKAMMATLARLVLEHGESALHSDVLDAILDNGGKFKVPADETIAGHASRARDALEKVLVNGGASSADAAALVMARNLLDRIASEGLAESKPASTVDDSNGASESDNADNADNDSNGASESAPQASESPANVEAGEPVALGKASGKRRARKAGGTL